MTAWRRSRPASRHDAWMRLVAAAPPAWVLAHARAVEALADAMAARAEAAGLPVDRELVRAGALLHDIGRSRVQDVTHAHVGAEMLRGEHWPDPLVRVVERHTGAGIRADEAPRLGLPARDYSPVTLEERIVAAADNLHSGDRRLILDEVRAKYHAKGLLDALARIEALHHALCEELGTDLEALQSSPLPVP